MDAPLLRGQLVSPCDHNGEAYPKSPKHLVRPSVDSQHEQIVPIVYGNV